MPLSGSIAGGTGRPLGFWVKLVDSLLEESVNADADEWGGVSRRHWQVFSVIRDGASSTAQVDAVLAPFVHAPGGTGTTSLLVDDLRHRGWVSGQEHLPGAPDDVGSLAVTVAGEAAYEELQAVIAHRRELVSEGIAARDYEVTVATLERVARNLGWQGDAR